MNAKRIPATELAYRSAADLMFGVSKYPVSVGRHIAIGRGAVLPEVKFTLPMMTITEQSMPEVRAQFTDMAERILARALRLDQQALVLELEHLPELTSHPEWGAQVAADIRRVMERFELQGLRSALRVTVVDIRDQERPPRVRSGEHIVTMMRALQRAAESGADILSIESTGGKEVHDRALLVADMDGIAYALGALAPRDMEFLWANIVRVADCTNVVAGGDTACGFANTAMQLAHQGMLPRVLAAVVRLMAAPRSLVAVEMGATGPLKDCGYENPIIKAIAGVPISMEGKTAACAHSSPLGNIAGAACDLWSNESVQNVRLLSGFAPEVFTEMLVYDTRLMNTALQSGQAETLRDLFVRSDRYRDPQALMLDPEVMFEAARRIVATGPDHYARTTAMARLAVETLRRAVGEGRLELATNEARWLAKLEVAVAELPGDEEELRRRVDPDYGSFYLPEEYGPLVTLPRPPIAARLPIEMEDCQPA